MTDLNEIQEVLNKYSDALDKLTEENTFLTETIKNQKMCLITQERRELLEKVRNTESEAIKVRSEAEKKQKTYEDATERLAGLMLEFDSKNKDLEEFIDQRADEKIAKLKKSIEKSMKKKHQETEEELKKHYEEMEKSTKKALTRFKILSVVCSVAAIVSIFYAIFM